MLDAGPFNGRLRWPSGAAAHHARQIDGRTRWGSLALAAAGAWLGGWLASWLPFLAGLFLATFWRYKDAQARLHRAAELWREEKKGRDRAEKALTPLRESLASERREHEELLADIASGRAEVVPRGWAGVPLQSYLVVRHEGEEELEQETSD